MKGTLKYIKLYLIFCIGVILSFPGYSQDDDYYAIYDDEEKIRSRIISIFDSLKIEYQLREYNGINILFQLPNNRKQIMHFDAKPTRINDYFLFKISSPAILFENESDLSQQILYQYLTKNYNNKLGSWQLSDGTPPYFLEYACSIDMNIPHKHILAILKFVAKKADEIESIFYNGKDDF